MLLATRIPECKECRSQHLWQTQGPWGAVARRALHLCGPSCPLAHHTLAETLWRSLRTSHPRRLAAHSLQPLVSLDSLPTRCYNRAPSAHAHMNQRLMRPCPMPAGLSEHALQRRLSAPGAHAHLLARTVRTGDLAQLACILSPAYYLIWDPFRAHLKSRVCESIHLVWPIVYDFNRKLAAQHLANDLHMAHCRVAQGSIISVSCHVLALHGTDY